MPSLKRRKRKEKEIAVIGLGRFGASLARRLEVLGNTVLGIDIDPQVVKRNSEGISETVIADAVNEEALKAVDITAFQTVVVAVGDNFEAGTLITATLKEMGISHVIAQSNSDRHREILLRIGADRVILPEEESGYQLAEEISAPGMLDILHLTEDYSLIEVKIPPGLVGKGVAACEPYDVIVVLILRGSDLVVSPDADARFQAGDILVMVGEKRRLAEFNNLQ